MFDNIIQNQGFTIALSGVIVVFSGLILIAVVIHIFNKIFEKSAAPLAANSHPGFEVPAENVLVPRGKPVPPDHLTVITVALEIYQKLYYDALDSEVTFKRGKQESGWKMGAKFGQRSNF